MLVVVTPLLPLGVLMFFYQDYTKTEVLSTHANLARIAGSAMAQQIEALQWRTAFAQELNSAKTSAEINKILNSALAANPDFLMLAVLDKNGRQTDAAGLKYVLEAVGKIDLSAEDALSYIRSEDRLNVSSFNISLGLPIAEMVLPLDDGRFMFGIVNFFNFWLRLEEQKIGESGHIYLVHETGRVFNFERGPSPFDPAAMRRFIENRQTFIKKLRGAEATLVGALRPSPVAEAYIAVLQNKNEAFKLINTVNLILLFFFLAIATMAYFAALRFAAGISEPVTNLIDASKRVAVGDYTPVPTQTEWQEINQLCAAFNAMMEDIEKYQTLKIKQQVAEMKDFVFKSVAHDLRAPLLGLQGYIELISNDKTPPADKKEYIKTMRMAAGELASLMEDVLDVSKLEAGVLNIKKEKFDFGAALENVITQLRPLSEDKKLEIKTAVLSKTPYYGDKKLISRVLINLISNAVKFTERGSVTITYNADRERFYVSVSDTGIGMDEQHHGAVFNKYNQLDERAKGWGLGLNISRQIVAAHGGEIDIKSSPGQGTTISFYTLRGGK